LGSSTLADVGDWIAVFLNRLHQLGWVEDRNVVIEYRWAEGRTERYAEIAAEFARLTVDVIAVSPNGGGPALRYLPVGSQKIDHRDDLR
jgi:putative ABC transport system substrate-binding protein